MSVPSHRLAGAGPGVTVPSNRLALSGAGRLRAALRDAIARPLPTAAAACCSVIVLGQMMFVAYVLAFYGRAAAAGRWADWNRGLSKGVGYLPGQTAHNLAVAAHLLAPVLLMTIGALQLVPAIRRRAPALHRWGGRVYLSCALLIGFTGEVMLWAGSGGGGPLMKTAISIDVVLIVAFVVLAWREALARRYDRHRRWALRLFFAVNGAWFFRIGLMAWILANRGPVGFDPKTFEGPFITFLAFGQYLLPLAVLEGYLRVQAMPGPIPRSVYAAGLAMLALVAGLGIVGASLALWLPRM